MTPACERTRDRVLVASTLGACWACYLPLGAKYATLSLAVLAAMIGLGRREDRAALAHARLAQISLALWLWLGLTASWSPAAGTTIASHLWSYGLPLLVPLIVATCPPARARRALAHFAVLSAAVGLLFVLAHNGLLPAHAWLWRTTVDAEGNQRIATSILLALGTGLALLAMLQATGLRRGAWLAAAAVSVAGLALQDRRTGMLLLPLLLLAWGLARQASAWRRLAIAAAIGLASVAAWQLSDGVRARFAEGLSELRSYRSDDQVATSWGQRLRLWELTAAMVAERPVAGHGVASWKGLWQSRVTPGTALAVHSTPHNEYLLLAQQGGAIAVLLWLCWLGAALAAALQAGTAGVAALMALTALACGGAFNAVLRDAKFALPLLLLAALGLAAAREPRPRADQAGPAAPPKR